MTIWFYLLASVRPSCTTSSMKTNRVNTKTLTYSCLSGCICCPPALTDPASRGQQPAVPHSHTLTHREKPDQQFTATSVCVKSCLAKGFASCLPL